MCLREMGRYDAHGDVTENGVSWQQPGTLTLPDAAVVSAACGVTASGWLEQSTLPTRGAETDGERTCPLTASPNTVALLHSAGAALRPR